MFVPYTKKITETNYNKKGGAPYYMFSFALSYVVVVIGQWNVNGLRTHTQDKSLDPSFLAWVQSMDITVLTETHLAKGDLLHVPGYRTFQVNRTRKGVWWCGYPY